MTDDIVARLRAEEWVDGSSVPTLINPNGPEAADEIERLRAERDAEREKWKAASEIAQEEFNAAEDLRAELVARDELLTEARIVLPCSPGYEGLIARIDAVLNPHKNTENGQ